MTSQSVIVHEWFYDGGPDTFEYLLPCRDVDPQHETLFNEWISRFADCSATNAARELQIYLDSIEAPAIQTITNLFRRLTPYSVVIHQRDLWLLCKTPNLFGQPSAHQNMILLPPPTEHQNWPSELIGDAFQPLRHLMQCFGGMRIDIPPTCGLLRPNEMEPAIEVEDDFIWKNICSWAGSFPVYNVGDGDTVLVAADARYGRWSHEMTNPAFVERMIREHGMTRPDDGAVFLIGDFDDFLNYVVAETGIAR